MRIALDAMGGDYAPGPNIDGAIAALQAHPDLEVVLVGDQLQLEPLLVKAGFSSERMILRHSDSWITMEEKPTEALRKKPNCSISVCWQMMAGREVDAVVSAGHTGAVVAAGLKTRLYLKNVKRPGIAVALPTQKGRAVLMDVGANPAARPEHLFQYGIMGLVYARDVLGIENPRVGLMNIGTEEGKGNALITETNELLKRVGEIINYAGPIEGFQVFTEHVDVVVCDGFVGNVALKASEGVARMLGDIAREEFKRSIFSKLGALFARPALQALRDRADPRNYNGASLVGLRGIVIKSHGSADAFSFAHAIDVAVLETEKAVPERISHLLEELLAGSDST